MSSTSFFRNSINCNGFVLFLTSQPQSHTNKSSALGCRDLPLSLASLIVQRQLHATLQRLMMMACVGPSVVDDDSSFLLRSELLCSHTGIHTYGTGSNDGLTALHFFVCPLSVYTCEYVIHTILCFSGVLYIRYGTPYRNVQGTRYTFGR